MPSNNASSIPESQVLPRAQENPWYIQHFIKLLIGFGLGGGAVAILLPWMLWLLCGMSSGSSDQLRLHLLYVTGGIIAVLTLLQTNWKNQGDRLKIDADIKKNEQDAEKNERDHIRQVHSERRSRYTKAIEQLADEKATVRLGGIYTLVGLVDEWLADDSLEQDEQQKEGQVIINSLCSYIRSPFPLALKAEMFEGDSEPDNYEGDFSKDQAAFHEEQDVRRTIFVEMSKRSSTFTRDAIRTVIDTFPGMWSDFEFDFSRAPIFYPLNAVTIEKGNFSGARFYAGANFVEATFTCYADFRAATFACYADFVMATFTSNANFSAANFTSNANFVAANFTSIADFHETRFTSDADFCWATFTSNADFYRTTFISNADFQGARFTSIASFSKATFTRRVIFCSTTFTQYGPIFAMADSEERKAQFSAGAEPRDYDFSVSSESKPIKCQTATLLGKSFTIPIGTILFDPDSWDKEKQEYTRISEPVQ
ncbi:pentapeptide repeat-containing protein [uncultured Rothia sp.]|uniref:pentapeptide repeat-containing protein n=1 Tax=uncultured Rothia sp. TaxID=316088 RepID=UPI0028D24287|nr:pentapeptide repeat-containing protein [uncultured Rothia sp.]